MHPNILVFLSDDHAQWAAGAYGNQEIQTPTLDHLARTGVRFDNAFTNSPVCSPARASFFTGRIPSQHGVHDYLGNADPDPGAPEWLRGERLLPEILKEHGYVTGLSGKWHLGDDAAPARGFDFWYSRGAAVSEADGYESPWQRRADVEQAYDHHAITTHALEFLENRPRDRPFFLVVGHIATHSPWSRGLERLVSRYRGCAFTDIPDDITYPFGRLRSESLYPSRREPSEALAQYYASVTEIDEQVGRLLDSLASTGAAENTAVVYTSDHGLNTGHHGIWGKGNGTLPYNVVEESIRIPLIVRFPGGALGGQRRAEPVTHVDTFQTILDLTGAACPSDRDTPYPGRSYAPLLVSAPDPGRDDAVFVEYGTLRAVRLGDLKLVRRYPEGPDELFDLVRDPRETRNAIHDPQHHEAVAALTARLEEYFARYEVPEHRGVDARLQPRHNRDEAWRDDGTIRLEESAEWLDRLEQRAQDRRARVGAGAVEHAGPHHHARGDDAFAESARVRYPLSEACE
ncbi:sulfatase-like hydrolase/transferase [Streptomyces sp. MS2A]|nr:sulfatase-like hydrolase/transferase [Streptomyces sp. MS2A]